VSQRNGSPKGLPRGTRGPDAHVEVGQVFPAPPAGVIVVVDVVPVPTIHVQSPSPSSKLGFEQPSDTDEHCVGGVAAAVVVGGFTVVGVGAVVPVDVVPGQSTQKGLPACEGPQLLQPGLLLESLTFLTRRLVLLTSRGARPPPSAQFKLETSQASGSGE